MLNLEKLFSRLDHEKRMKQKFEVISRNGNRVVAKLVKIKEPNAVMKTVPTGEKVSFGLKTTARRFHGAIAP